MVRVALPAVSVAAAVGVTVVDDWVGLLELPQQPIMARAATAAAARVSFFEVIGFLSFGLLTCVSSERPRLEWSSREHVTTL
jgi:hypothetical protein